MLNREPMGMKHGKTCGPPWCLLCFSAQPRADGDEARTGILSAHRVAASFSAQPRADGDEAELRRQGNLEVVGFSAQPRADGDEAMHPCTLAGMQ